MWIFTNQDDPTHGDENQRNRLSTLKKDCREADIALHVLPLPKNAHGGAAIKFDRDIIYNDLTSSYKRVEDVCEESGGVVDIEVILENFAKGMKKRRKYATVPLLLPGWKERKDDPGILLDLYSIVTTRSKPAKVAVHQEKNKATKKVTKRINKETDEEVDKEDVHQFVDFCGRVPIQPADIATMKRLSNSSEEASLVLHGFRPMKLLPKTNLITKNALAYANDYRVRGSGKALYNLKQSMKKKDVFAVGELLTRSSASSRMIAMVPTKNDDSGGFLVTQLPYKEDTRAVPQSDIGFADRESVDAAKGIIEKSVMNRGEHAFTDLLPENPWLKHFFGYLESVSLGQPLQDVEDNAKMDVDQMLKVASEEISSFSLSLPEDDEPVKKDRKRKAPGTTASKPEFVKESISEEWIDRYKHDEVGDCTATELKAFLKTQGERLAGKKGDLVDRVCRCIEKEVFKR